MKKMICLLLCLFLLSCTNSEDKQLTPIIKDDTPIVTPEPNTNKEEENKTENEIPIDVVNHRLANLQSFTIIPDVLTNTYHITDQLSLHIEVEVDNPSYCQEACLVAKEIYLEKENQTHLEVLEKSPIKVNNVYGTLTLTRIDEFYLLSFNTAAQIAGEYGILFDIDGNVLEEFRNVTFDLENLNEKEFIVKYLCSSDRFGCDIILNPYANIDTYTISEKDYSVSREEIKGKPIELVRREANEVGADVSLAKIAFLGDYTIEEVLEKTSYVDNYPFIKEIDSKHIVDASGKNLYCIIPSDEEMIISVYIYDYEEEKEKEIARFDDGKAIFILSTEIDNFIKIKIDNYVEEVPIAPLSKDTQYEDVFVKDLTDHNLSYDKEDYQCYLFSIVKDLDQYEEDPMNYQRKEIIGFDEYLLAQFGKKEDDSFQIEKTYAISLDLLHIYEFDDEESVWNLITK